MRRAFPPYARYSARQASTAAAIGRLEQDFEHIRKRHTEQIERLENLVSELVLAAEGLRREIGEVEVAVKEVRAARTQAKDSNEDRCS